MVAALDNLVRLQKSQIKPAGEMIARVFQDDPLNSYFIPDATQRRSKLHYVFEFLIHYGILYGEVYATSPNLEGVAVWLPSKNAKINLWRGIWSGGFPLYCKLGKEVIWRQMSVDDYISSIHKRYAPFRHWYLSLIGVDPMFQGKGYAGILLKAMLARLDEEHLPCYLETQNEKNVSIYQHYGFKVVEEAVIPDTEISLRAMLRGSSG